MYGNKSRIVIIIEIIRKNANRYHQFPTVISQLLFIESTGLLFSTTEDTGDRINLKRRNIPGIINAMKPANIISDDKTVVASNAGYLLTALFNILPKFCFFSPILINTKSLIKTPARKTRMKDIKRKYRLKLFCGINLIAFMVI